MDPMSLLLQHNGFYDDPIDVDQEQDYAMRRKPGRKPVPTSAAARKAQNREAQRAFRERKERHLKELEDMVKKLKVDRRATLRQRDTYKSKAEQLRIQNWYLKGLILTLQLVCMQNKVVIPPHSPFLNEESLCEIAKVLPPEVIESYVKAASPSGITKGENEPIKPEPPMKDDLYIDEEDSSPSMSPFSHTTKSPTWPAKDVSPPVKQEDHQPSTLKAYNSAPDSTPPRQANLAAIQHIKMKLAMEELFSTTQSSTTGMQPTILQVSWLEKKGNLFSDGKRRSTISKKKLSAVDFGYLV
jgi:bZIP transcription factor